MNQEFTFLDLFTILRRRRMLIAGLVGICTLLGLLACVFSTRRYSAEGTLQVQKETSDMLGISDLMGGAGMDGGSDALTANITIQTQAKILQSDTLALRVMKELNLEHTADFEGQGVLDKVLGWFTPSRPEEAANIPLENSPRRRTRALKIFEKHLKVEPIGGTRLVTIKYLNADPKLAAAVVNGLMQGLISYTVETRFAATNQASDWLNAQMGDLKKQAENLQAKVVSLQRASGVYSLGTPDATGKEQVYSSVLDRLQQATATLSAAESNRIVKGAIYDYAKNGNAEMISGLGGTSITSTSPMATSLQLLQNLRMQQATVQAEVQQDKVKFGTAYPKLAELTQNEVSLNAAIEAELNRITDRAKNDYLIAEQTREKAQAIYDREKAQAGKLNDTAIEYAITRQEADESRGLYEDLLKHLKEAGVMEGLKSTNLTVVDPGRAPEAPSTPNVPVYMGVAILFGLLSGTTSALLLDTLDNKIHSEDQLHVEGSAVFGIIPQFDLKATSPSGTSNTESKSSVLLPQVLRDPRSPYAEALRNLMLSITMARGDRQPKVILITSAIPGEGKTETSFNLAVLFAQRHMSVLLIEADMRRPKLQRRLGLSATGLSSVLSGASETAEIQTVPDLQNLNILVAGPIPPDPSELLNSDRLKALVSEWSKSYDLVIIDTSPVLAVSDAASLLPLVDVALVIARFEYTAKQSLRRCIHNLRSVSSKPIGVVLNGMRFGSAAYYEYYGYHGVAYYGEEKDK